MKLKVLKTGHVALSPSVTEWKMKGDEVNIVNEDHAKYLIGKKVLGKIGKKSTKKMDKDVDNKAEKVTDEDKNKSKG